MENEFTVMAGNKPPPALFTDLYELTMAQAYWHSGQTAEATFSLYFRSYPPDRASFVLGGIEDALSYLEGLQFSRDDIDFLRSTSVFGGAFLEYLAVLRFTGSVRGMREGSIFFADEPVIEVTAPIIEAQLVETSLLNQINLQTVLATKASRVVHAASGKTVVDFAARRTHGVDAASKLARASYMTGFAGTSNVMAGKQYDIPIFGTMAHSFVQSFGSEEESFRRYAESFPDDSTFLVDTYDTVDGVRRAIKVAHQMQRRDHALRAVRLDSGDLLGLSIKTRAMLDEAGLPNVQVFVSGGLDEYGVDALLRSGAPIDGFGVGTKIGVSADAPWADCVYKLVDFGGRPTMKLSSRKQTLPGPKQVYRYRDESGEYLRDILSTAGQGPPEAGGEPLLTPVMTGGRRLKPPEPLQKLRLRFRDEFRYLPERHKALRSPAKYRVTVSRELKERRQTVARAAWKRQVGRTCPD